MLQARRAVLALVCVVATTLGAAAPTEAARPKVIRHAQACAWYMPPEISDERSLTVDVVAGRFVTTDGSGQTGACYDQFTEFRRSIRGGFHATVRWYVGKRLAATQRRKVANTGFDGSFRFVRPRLHAVTEGYEQTWAIGKRRVTARITFVKKGYRKARVRVTTFHYPSE